jgi:hypothetical protein
MAKSGKFVLIIAVILVVIAFAFQRQISQFLFSPEGLSLAASELCFKNQTDQNLVVDISVEGGERMIVLLVPDETGCAASPDNARKGTVKVGLSEKEGPFCLREAVSGDRLKLEMFATDNNCGWPN